MSTGNFYKRNAGFYYAVLMGDCDYDQCLIEKEFLIDNLSEKIPDMIVIDELRHDETIIGTIKRRLFNVKRGILKGYYADVEADVVLRPGYYEGANLDWDIVLTFADDNCRCRFGDKFYDCVENIIDGCIIDETNDNWNRKKESHKEVIMDRIEKAINKIIDELEKAFMEVSEPFYKKAVFSNGETIYEKVNSI